MSASIASMSSAVISGNDGVRGAGGGAIVSNVDAILCCCWTLGLLYD